MSRWNDADVRELAPAVRRGRRSKGVARALRQIKRAEADDRNAKTKRNRRRQARLKGEAEE
jgi:hypothetical protein